MGLNILLTTQIQGVEVQFGTNDEAEKFSLLAEFPQWSIEKTVGKGSKKVVVGYVPATISKRSVSSMMDSNEEDIPAKYFIRDVDESAPGFRAFLGKSGIREISEVKTFVATLNVTMEELTPKIGSVADPLLEAKKVFAKSSTFETLDYENVAGIFNTWKAERLEEIQRVMEKAAQLTVEDFRSFVNKKFLDNGVDEDGFLRLKAMKGSDKTEPSEGAPQE